MKKFIIIGESLSKTDADLLTAHLSVRFAYWHWIENAWIITTSDQFPETAKALHEWLVNMMPTLTTRTMLVLRLDDPKSYWGRAQPASWDWLAGSDFGTAS